MPLRLWDECLEVPKAFPGRQGGVWGAWGCFGVSRGVLGVLEGVRMLWGISRSVSYSIPTNFHGALIKALTFSRRPGCFKCLKYHVKSSLLMSSLHKMSSNNIAFQTFDIKVSYIFKKNFPRKIPNHDEIEEVICVITKEKGTISDVARERTPWRLGI